MRVYKQVPVVVKACSLPPGKNGENGRLLDSNNKLHKSYCLLQGIQTKTNICHNIYEIVGSLIEEMS